MTKMYLFVIIRMIMGDNSMAIEFVGKYSNNLLAKDYDAIMVELWDYYLVYSIAFSISSIASNEMYDFFGKKYSNLKSQNPMEELIFLLAN